MGIAPVVEGDLSGQEQSGIRVDGTSGVLEITVNVGLLTRVENDVFDSILLESLFIT